MKKLREQRLFTCISCSRQFYTRANRILRCIPCSKEVDYYQNRDSVESRIKNLLAGAKHRSKQRGLPFNLTIDYLKELFLKSNGKCAVSGRAFDLTPSGTKRQVNPNAPSIDRIIPDKGYVKGNVRFVVYHANVAIYEFGLDSLIGLATDILNYKAESNSDKEING